jgi:hypothetical protein
MPVPGGRLEHGVQIVHVVARHQNRLAGAPVRGDDCVGSMAPNVALCASSSSCVTRKLSAPQRSAAPSIASSGWSSLAQNASSSAMPCVGRGVERAQHARVLGVGAQALDAVRDQLEQAGAVGADAAHRALDADVVVARPRPPRAPTSPPLAGTATRRGRRRRRGALVLGLTSFCAAAARFAAVSWISRRRCAPSQS